MRRIAIMLLSVSALAATTELATARDGCGEGHYWNGYRCTWMSNSSFYVRRPDYGYRFYDRPIQGESSYGQPEVWFRVQYDRSGRPYCAQRGYTVQDGVCKRYRGY